MTKRARAAGGGRKPRGEYPKQKVPLSVRITEETSIRLEREIKRTGRSLTQQVEFLLCSALDFPKRAKQDWKADHYYGLGRAVARLAWVVEVSTGIHTRNEPQVKTWCDDAFTAAALRSAIDILVRGLTAEIQDGPMKIPERVKQGAKINSEHLPADQVAFYMTPEGIGSIAGMSLLNDLDTYDFPPVDHPTNTRYADLFYDIPHIRKAMGLRRKIAT